MLNWMTIAILELRSQTPTHDHLHQNDRRPHSPALPPSFTARFAHR
ncbi:hypothetical protein AM1_B0100 (plasmid) [Acaryochloris marina MBIC11017]|uniref:Uncharacterized protein n=1 Tax=Acaryochloris marina (strain MBIC 11017) TaxID=329726 RepID=A8ZM57_ACAM1|nr:hypothetical protein AM1_B0100 [Acaryochloris marina MBIC11017]